MHTEHDRFDVDTTNDGLVRLRIHAPLYLKIQSVWEHALEVVDMVPVSAMELAELCLSHVAEIPEGVMRLIALFLKLASTQEWVELVPWVSRTTTATTRSSGHIVPTESA